MRTTNVASVVRATDDSGTKRVAWDRRTGQSTSGNMPEARSPFGFVTSSSTGIVRVFTSTERAIRATVPAKVWFGNADTLNSTLAPSDMPSAYFSGTGTTNRSLATCSIRKRGTLLLDPVVGPTRAPG